MLMFSGGRDSTLAAARLAEKSIPTTLVTLTSAHLFGLAQVRQRLEELARSLPGETRWMQVVQPTSLRTDTSFYEQTCLPCHHAYVVAAAVLAKRFGLQTLAFGYAGYQADWPEQTPLAIERLREVLHRHELELMLPVYDLTSREAAIAELSERGFSVASLEQKCTRQITNVRLAPDRLAAQIDLWERAIDESLEAVEELEVTMARDQTLSSFVTEVVGR